MQVTQDTCTPDVEILSASLRPYYLPREFPKVNVNIVYVPPDGNDSIAAQAISDVVNQQLTASPDSVVIVTGDFNTCVIDSYIPHFTQYIDFPTRKEKTIDKCYVNVKNAYKAKQLPALGESDHLMIELLPAYKTLMKRMPVEKKEIRAWDDSDACQSLRGCFECTDWNVFFDDCNDLDEANDVVTDYIKFCESVCIKTKTIKSFPNNKPWVTKEIKEVINEKKRAFAEGNKDKIKAVQKKLSKMIREGKDKYKQKLERSFKDGNSREAWAGMNKIAGVNKTNSNLMVEDGKSYADELNEFYSRFDEDATPDLNSKFKHDFLSDFPADENIPVFAEEETKSVFKKLNANKAHGPDGISNKILKLCYMQLAVPFTSLFNWSMKDHKLPSLWKTSEIVPTPKKPKVTVLNDLRPVALTSVIVKCFEKLILSRLLPAVYPHQDPFQFAYKSKRSVDDAIAYFF